MTAPARSLTVQVPLTIRRRPGRKTVVTPVQAGEGGTTTPTDTIPTRADPALVKALAQAFRYQRLLDEGRYASISEMARAERIERGYLESLLRLTLLALESVEAVLDRAFPTGALPQLLERFPLEWRAQKECLGPRSLVRLYGPCISPARASGSGGRRAPSARRSRSEPGRAD